MRRRTVLGAGTAALATAAAIGGIAIAGGGDERGLEARVTAGPLTATKAGPVTRGGGGPVIQTFYLQDAVAPPVNGGTVVGVRCPNNAGAAIGGGAATDQGIVVSYLSQIKPGANPSTTQRTYYVGVDDNSRQNAANAGARLEVHCAKGITVKK